MQDMTLCDILTPIVSKGNVCVFRGGGGALPFRGIPGGGGGRSIVNHTPLPPFPNPDSASDLLQFIHSRALSINICVVNFYFLFHCR